MNYSETVAVLKLELQCYILNLFFLIGESRLDGYRKNEGRNYQLQTIYTGSWQNYMIWLLQMFVQIKWIAERG